MNCWSSFDRALLPARYQDADAPREKTASRFGVKRERWVNVGVQLCVVHMPFRLSPLAIVIVVASLRRPAYAISDKRNRRTYAASVSACTPRRVCGTLWSAWRTLLPKNQFPNEARLSVSAQHSARPSNKAEDCRRVAWFHRRLSEKLNLTCIRSNAVALKR